MSFCRRCRSRPGNVIWTRRHSTGRWSAGRFPIRSLWSRWGAAPVCTSIRWAARKRSKCCLTCMTTWWYRSIWTGRNTARTSTWIWSPAGVLPSLWRRRSRCGRERRISRYLLRMRNCLSWSGISRRPAGFAGWSILIYLRLTAFIIFPRWIRGSAAAIPTPTPAGWICRQPCSGIWQDRRMRWRSGRMQRISAWWNTMRSRSGTWAGPGSCLKDKKNGAAWEKYWS